MFDKFEVQLVEIDIDHTGKIWVNVDGVCQVRVGKAIEIVITDKRPSRNPSGRKY